MRPSRIKAKLKRGQPVLITQLHLTDPSLFEMTSLMGFDGIWMDMEHHGYSLETASGLIRATRVGVTYSWPPMRPATSRVPTSWWTAVGPLGSDDPGDAGALRPADFCQGNLETLHDIRRQRLAQARHRRREENLHLRQFTQPLAGGDIM